MKYIITLLFLVISNMAFSQAPEKMSYQAVIRDSNNNIISNQSISIRISILRGSPTGNTVYSETHSKSTNFNGLISLEIGEGSNKIGSIGGIQWDKDQYFIQTETDPYGGNSYILNGVNQILSVAYALHSNTADSLIGGGIGPQGPKGLTGPQGPQGIQGLTGATGPQGPIGLTGPQGLKGDTGVAGPQGPIGLTGATGPQGPIGLTGPQGLKGDTGVAGPQGAIGLTGATGPQGPIGLTGPQGATGPQGIQGLTGPQGAIGLTGPQGLKGDTGVAGPQGIQGLTGATGPQGPIGLTGPQGLKGDTGVAGPQGIQGLTGPQGAIGLTGPQGLKGDTGVAGPQGIQGLTGPQGAIGLTGPQGLKGDTGVAGPQGIQGLTGATGPQGPIGLTGPQGLKGDTGVAGPQGIQGLTGPQGAIGLTGPQGLKGDTGVAGPQGPIGLTGATGPQGPIGLTGPQGLKGDTGVAGPQGPIGLTGPQGLKGDTGGPQGPIGLTGPQGLKGDTGATGPQGPIGLTGATGPQGPIGLTGATGLLSNGAAAGNTPYWDGSQWVVNNSNIHNNGSGIGINTSTPNASAQLDVASSTKGFLPPRMTTVQRDAIATPAAGLVIYNTTRNCLNFYTGANWNETCGSISPTTGGTYPSGSVFCASGPTAIVNVTSPTGKIWMDRNLGATRVARSKTDASSYGDLYQWGRGSDGHQCKTGPTTTTLSSVDQPNHSDFILAPNSPYDWRSPQNANLWQGVNGVNNPCPSGYRVPTEAELNAERLSWALGNNSAGAFGSPLKLPAAGYRHGMLGSKFGVGQSGSYWSSSVNAQNISVILSFGNSNSNMAALYQGAGRSVRCIRD